MPVQPFPAIEPPPPVMLPLPGPELDIIEPIEEPPPQLESATSPQSASNTDATTRDSRPNLPEHSIAALREQGLSLAYACHREQLPRDVSLFGDSARRPMAELRAL